MARDRHAIADTVYNGSVYSDRAVLHCGSTNDPATFIAAENTTGVKRKQRSGYWPERFLHLKHRAPQNPRFTGITRDIV